MATSVSNIRDINSTTLPNGVRVITETMPHVRSVSVGLWIGTGARHESKTQNGISHFIEHMVFKGTRNRSAEEIATVVDSTGGNLDAYTSKELVSFNTKVINDHLPVAFDVLSDLVLNPLFRADDIEKEKGVILEELKMEVDNPEYLVHETFSSNFWRNHPLGRSILGTKSTIKGFTQAAVEDYYRSVYAPDNILITAAGRLEHAQIVDLAARYFEGLAQSAPLPPEAPPESFAPLVLKNKTSLEQVHVYMGVPAYPIADERRYGCYVLSTLLGGGMSSRLFQNIREKNGLAYAVFSELNLYRDTGCLAVYAGTSTTNARKVIEMIRAEFSRLTNEPVPAEELRRAKDHLKGSLALSLESTSSRMSNLARQELFFGRFFTVDEMVESIEQVTTEEVHA
ncbi:MAG: M16 family metallopeptidase, partial [Bryobacteraceae bacterium]